MNRMLVAGNWKMHGSHALVEELLQALVAARRGADADAAEVVVFPPFPYLHRTREVLADSGLRWGAQTLHPEAQGAYTGEVSGPMLAEFGCHYVLVGHSERRALCGERDADVARRFAAAVRAGLAPVLCVGETLAERERRVTEEVVGRQLDAVITHCGIEAFATAVVAYEPVWAIGTGNTATAAQAQAVHAFIRDKLSGADGIISGQIRILYGGSVNAGNAADLFAQDDIDGGLAGGASLRAAEFLAICEAAG